MESESALQAIERTIHRYFHGMHFRDLAELRSVFHPSAVLYGHLEGAFSQRTLEEWLAGVQSRPIPAEVGEPFDMKIVSVDITGRVASVKVADYYRGLYFTDYLSLAEVEGTWLIVNKLFHHD